MSTSRLPQSVQSSILADIALCGGGPCDCRGRAAASSPALATVAESCPDNPQASSLPPLSPDRPEPAESTTYDPSCPGCPEFIAVQGERDVLVMQLIDLQQRLADCLERCR